MPRRVRTPDGTVHNFPDDATDAEISEALSAPPPTARGPEKTKSWTDMAVNALPMIGGAVGGVLGAMSGIPTLGLTSGPAAVAGAGLLGAGGEAAKQLINRARGQDAPTTPGQAATDIGLQGATQAGAEVVGQGVSKALTGAGRMVYRGFLKPSLAKQSLGKANQIVETALQEALPVTKSGSAKAHGLINDLRGEVETMVDRASAKGETVDLGAVAQRVRIFARQKYFRPGRPLEDYEAALKVADALDAHPSLNGTTEVPLRTAQEMKVDMGQAIGDQNFGLERGAVKTTQKVARSELRRQVELGTAAEGEGAVKGLNAREGRLLDAAKAIARAVGREENKSPLIGVNTMISGAVGTGTYAKTKDPYQAAVNTLATRMALTPAVASRAAIVAYKLGQMSPTVPATIARLAIQAVQESEQ